MASNSYMRNWLLGTFILLKCASCFISQTSPGDSRCVLVDEERLVASFKAGLPYVHDLWIEDEEIVEGMVKQIRHLQEEHKFLPSGLSVNTDDKDRGFNEADRTVCGINIYSEEDMKKLSEPAMLTISQRMVALQRELSVVLDRPSLADASLAHESYFSSSKAGAFLKRHLDERHEGLKRRKAWLLPSRRSISWLLYLSPPGWDYGGEFRCFPPIELMESSVVFHPERVNDGKNGYLYHYSADHIERNSTIEVRGDQSGEMFFGNAGSHEGDLQVGWLRRRPQGAGSKETLQPVYLDAWKRAAGGGPPVAALFVVRGPAGGGGGGGGGPARREYVTRDFDADALDLPDALAGRGPAGPAALFLAPADAAGFAPLEDRARWEEEEAAAAAGAGGAPGPPPPPGAAAVSVAPRRARLLLFDSVALPHEVAAVAPGAGARERLALAGWFHEATQPFPEWE